ncbi:Similar to Srl: Sarcalumenin (Mus musculus) [Cotesia congregata]|uniref:Similar to Srl: Sarcalumenin (Mus musculus) n=1 Tax=Cotesia congregata TaxID=51543 RepID=A0A8J2EDZ4_COTCN|nr:Similar to Srl: Sarcalumenin (Mus musculus) [Cotesia congregata]
MTGSARLRPVVVVGLILALLAVALREVQGDDQLDVSEVQCRPFIEKALKDLGTGKVQEFLVFGFYFEILKGWLVFFIVGNVEEGSREDDGQGSDQGGSYEEQSDGKEDDKSDGQSGEQTDGLSGEQTEGLSGEQIEAADGQSEEKSDVGDGQSEEEKTEATDETTDGQSEEKSDVGDGQSEEEKVDGQSDEEKTDGQSEEEKTDGKSEEEVTDGKSEEEKADGQSGETQEVQDQADEPDHKEGSEESTTEIPESGEQSEDNKESVEQSTEKSDEPEQESKEADKVDESQENTETETTEIEKDETAEKSDEVVEPADEIDSKETEQENTEKNKSEETGDAEKSEETGEQDKTEEIVAESGETGETKEEVDTTEEAKSEEAKSGEASAEDTKENQSVEEVVESEEVKVSEAEKSDENTVEEGSEEKKESEEKGEENEVLSREKRDVGEESAEGEQEKSEEEAAQGSTEDGEEPSPEEDLIQEIEIPENLRSRDHINQILRLDQENEEKEAAIAKAADVVLKELKRLYDTAIQPLETLYKYRDLSNRHFGDPEIFSKPLILFMGPWSGGKSSIINYLLDNEYKTTALRTGDSQECSEESCESPIQTDPGAEPSPAYFNIVMHGEEEEVLDGTQLAADWTFSGLQKFGQGLLDRLRGLKLNNKLLEKVNIVEIPGILEIRKQVQRLFPFNDACQWFIDRADIIFLIYDPSKLDVGPETEAILDQLKGREYQTRIVLNKADQVKPEELMRVQGALIWNISPLMSSAEPPVMYSTSLWSMPYEAGAPTRLLYAQERAFLRDLRSAIDKRTFFGSKKDISDRIIENPQEYHIYEGLSTLTNISRYDLPDPDVYRDFFRLNQLYDFPLLSSTCTYFRGCPINRLDVAIAYDLPELVGKYKKAVEAAVHEDDKPPAS